MDAKKTAESEGAKATLEKINKALEFLDKQCERMKKKCMMMEGKKCPMCGKTMGMKGIVNARCPITGKELNPQNVPEKLTRMWKGKKIGFCCDGCPEQWDKLSDEERQKKLDAAMNQTDKPVNSK